MKGIIIIIYIITWVLFVEVINNAGTVENELNIINRDYPVHQLNYNNRTNRYYGIITNPKFVENIKQYCNISKYEIDLYATDLAFYCNNNITEIMNYHNSRDDEYYKKQRDIYYNLDYWSKVILRFQFLIFIETIFFLFMMIQ